MALPPMDVKLHDLATDPVIMADLRKLLSNRNIAGAYGPLLLAAIEEHVGATPQPVAIIQRRPAPSTEWTGGISKLRAFAAAPVASFEVLHTAYGDLFYVKSIWSSDKIAGVAGPTLVAAFEDHMDAHRLARSVPSGVTHLLGPVLATLNGPSYKARWANLAMAFAPGHQFEPIVQRLFRDELAAAHAAGRTFSFTVLAQRLVLKLLLALLFGVTTSSQLELANVQHWIDTMVATLPQSTVAPHNDALQAKERLMSTLLQPALLASRRRVDAKAPVACVLDNLVLKNDLSDDVIMLELLHALYSGAGPLAALLANSISASHAYPAAWAKLVAAALAHKQQTPGAWKFGRAFAKEIQRFYRVGSGLRFAQATTDVTFAVNDVVYTVPKDTVVVAGIDVTHKHAASWTAPASFIPNRFLDDAESTKNVLRLFQLGGVSDALPTMVLESWLLAVTDYTWFLTPGQDISLDKASVTSPLPVGKLMASHMERRLGVAAIPDASALVRLPTTDEYAALIAVANEQLLTNDPRLDFWTRQMYKLVLIKLSRWTRPEAAKALTIPAIMGPVDKMTLAQTNIQVPLDDEDWPNQPWIEIKFANAIRDYAPFIDNFDENWLPGEDKERYVMRFYAHIWPRIQVHWNDRYSDRALELLAFNGLGQHMLQKLPTAHSDGSYYTIATNFMQALDVRKGFARYGADVFFDDKCKVTKIVRGKITYRPDDAEWEYVKMCFRGSLQTKVTAINHLLLVHSTIANHVTVVHREELPPTHPLRRLLKPFTFRSAAINYTAGRALFSAKGMLQRATALTTKGMKQAWDTGLASFAYEPFPAMVARQNIDTTTLPLHEDGIDYWYIVSRFVSSYLALYYTADAEVTSDASVVTFWTVLDATLPFALPVLSLTSLHEFVTYFIFMVSSMHNHVGAIAEYVSDPAFCPSAWVEGERAGRPGTSVQLALIMVVTGFDQPQITEDFSHVMLDDAAMSAARAFTASVKAQIPVVDRRNASRVQPFQSFNPSTMEMAVGI